MNRVSGLLSTTELCRIFDSHVKTTTNESGRELCEEMKTMKAPLVKKAKKKPACPSPVMTAAELVRHHQKKQQLADDATGDRKEDAAVVNDSVDLDEEIRRLEQELANDSDDESNDDDDSTSAEQAGLHTATVLSFSSSKAAAIEHLPASSLPTITRKRKGGDDEGTASRRKARNETASHTVSDGLQAAVQELLRDYTPRSAERLPFYCRVCAQQYTDEASFVAHKSEAFHTTAVAMERKASTCTLCRKTFTSPVQLREHLQSKPHKERLHSVQQRQKRPAGASIQRPPRPNGRSDRPVASHSSHTRRR